MPRPMIPLLILFDIDGTLVDSAGCGRRSIEAAFRAVFATRDIEAASARVRFNGKTDPVILLEIARAAGIDDLSFHTRRGALAHAYETALRAELTGPDPRRRVLPGVIDLLEHLTEHDFVHLGLLTGNTETGARLKLEALGLGRYFRSGGFGSDHPDRDEIARRAHAKMSTRTGIAFEPSRTTVLGDTELDVACALANGFRAVAVASGGMELSRLAEAGAHAVLPDLEDRAAVLKALGVVEAS